MKQNNRISRINDEILRETALILRGELQDPRLGAMTSVTKVDTTTDLQQCKIYVSVMGDSEQKQAVMAGLKNATGYIRKALAARINLRNTPELFFLLDDSLEYASHMNQLMKKIAPKEQE